MDRIGKVIARHRKNKKMSQPELAKRLTENGYPIKAGSVSAWELGVNQISGPLLLEVCKILEITDIYEEFIGKNPDNPFSTLNEKGKSKLMEYATLLLLSDEYKKIEPIIIPFTRKLPLFDLPASAGTGHFLDGESYEMMEVGNEVPTTADFGIKVSGDSMTPRFLDKQIVWVQKTESLHDGEFGIFYLDGNSYIKKLQDNQDGLFLISLNPDYPPIPVKEDSSFKTFGRVVG